MSTLDTIQKHVATGDDAAARAALVEWLGAPPADAEVCARAARLAETLGMATLAIRAWQLVLKERPEEREAWRSLGELHEERGDHARAATCRQRAGVASVAAPAGGQGSSGEPPDQVPDAPMPGPTDADLIRAVHLFGGREDTHARMWREGENTGWSPVHAPLTPELLRAHVHGSQTLGVYLVRLDGTAGAMALDLDIRKAALERVRGDAKATEALRGKVRAEGARILAILEAEGFAPLYVDSGYKGRHFWIFPEHPLPAPLAFQAIRSLAAKVQGADPDFCVEAFPKQGQLREGGLGNLIKLPLGLHLRTGRRAALLAADGSPIADPWLRLRQVRRIGTARFQVLPVAPEGRAGEAGGAGTGAAGAGAGAGVGMGAGVGAGRSPAPPVEKRPWNEADYEADPEVGTVVGRCPVVGSILRTALAERALRREAALVLQHTLGHLPNGPKALNHLFDRIPGFPADQRMGAPLRGSPVSCAKVRQRMSDVATQVGCDCIFTEKAGEYPHPLRHLEHRPAPVAPVASIDDLLDACGRILERQRLIAQEVAVAQRRAAEALARVPDRRWRRDGGEWVLEDIEGLPVVRWVPDGSSGGGAL